MRIAVQKNDFRLKGTFEREERQFEMFRDEKIIITCLYKKNKIILLLK